MNIVLAQLNFTVGHIQSNAKKIIDAAKRARDELKADVIVFPELALSGYPPEDLLFREDFLAAIKKALQTIATTVSDILIIVGYPENHFNSAAVLLDGKQIANYRKQCLPNYGVFDERRYFQPGNQPIVVEYKNKKLGLLICEDLWFKEPAQLAKAQGADILITLNASPFDVDKIATREKIAKERHKETKLPILYAHHVGAQDDLIFDGSSFAVNNQGKISARAPFGEENLLIINADTLQGELHKTPERNAQIYQALVLGVRDYVHKNNFEKVMLGLSGGIDSALTLTIAIDALGKDNVTVIALPSRHTSNLSMKALQQQVNLTKVKHHIISIEPAYEAFLVTLDQRLKDLTLQNLQARCRSVMLMALSNQMNALLLNTSNKSETAVGYGTLYGDMAGAYAVLKDVWKTDVYNLANYRNQISKVIPDIIITRAPSAELAPDQLDEDNLPAYATLDPILELYVEQDKSLDEIVAKGFAKEVVEQVIRLVNLNEYKRKQFAPGPKISARAFARERRYPICFR